MKTFNEKIYEKLKKVPKGKVISYKKLAESIGSKAYRAVGSAMRNNKDTINIPCYKVIMSTGEIGDYSSHGGVKEKIRSLKRDGIKIKNNKIDLGKYGYSFFKR